MTYLPHPCQALSAVVVGLQDSCNSICEYASSVSFLESCYGYWCSQGQILKCSWWDRVSQLEFPGSSANPTTQKLVTPVSHLTSPSPLPSWVFKDFAVVMTPFYTAASVSASLLCPSYQQYQQLEFLPQQKSKIKTKSSCLPICFSSSTSILCSPSQQNS